MNASTRRVAVLGGTRIPFARQNGPYARASNQDMLTATLEALIGKFSLEDETLGEVAAGGVLKHSRDFNLTREAVLGTRLNPHTPAYDVQQACGTGLEAAILVANKIALGQVDSGIAGGFDTTSDAPIAINEDLRAGAARDQPIQEQRGAAEGARQAPPAADRPADPAQRRAPNRAVDGRARRDHGQGVGDLARGAGRADRPQPQEPRRRVRHRLPRRSRRPVPRPRARPEPAARHERREAREVEAGVRRGTGNHDRRQLDPAQRRRLGRAARQRGVGGRARPARCRRTSSTPRPPPSTTCTSARAC